jgi:uncharacterized repeat protein (TIGR03803 family)
MRKIGTLFLIVANSIWAADGFKVLHAFSARYLRNGNNLYAGPILDASGNVYGVAESGGTRGAGLVYELSPTADGAWIETVLYNFKGGAEDGANPHATLMADRAGNLYGTTASGGLAAKTCNTGCGTVFMLTAAAGYWQESVLYRFTGGADGAVPYAGVVMDSAGNLYGATYAGGSGVGVVYKLTPGSAGWQQTVLYTFPGRPGGSKPFATPVLDAAGNLFGTTNVGGTHHLGIVYMLAPQPDGTWTEKVLHTFAGGDDGANPLAGLNFDQRGNVYGTTSYGGTANCGTAFELVPNTAGGWSERLLHTFLGAPYDGENPNGLVFDAYGNLYGTTTGGGIDNPGTIFKMMYDPTAGWQETVLYSFTGGHTGVYPISGLVLDTSGNLYGTTLWGGPTGDTTGGVIFQFAQ